MNQDKFNFRISVAQLVVGTISTPLVLSISKNYEDYEGNEALPDPKNMALGDFMKTYFSEGFKCLIIMGDTTDTCNFVLFYLIGYVFSLFVLQLSLTYVSR